MTLDFTNKNPNPIFSDYRLIDKDFQEGILPKSSYELEIERLEKEKAERQKNIQKTGYQSLKNAYSLNGTALSDIPSLPEFAQNAYKDYAKTPEWLDTLQVATPDEIEEWRKMGKMGIAETWAKKRKWEIIPFVGTTAETSLLVNNANTLRKIKNGEEVSEKDKELLVDYLRDLKEVEARGGHTLAGSAMDVIMSSIPYLGEFGAALALSPEGVGLGVAAKQLADIGAKRAARKALKKAITNNLMSGAEKKISLSAAKNIYKDALKTSTKNTFKNVTENMTKKEIASTILKSTPKMLKSSFRAGAVITPQNFVRSVTDRQLSTGVYVTDEGDAVFRDSENIALSIMKAIGEKTFEALTETAGSAFAPTIKYFAKPIRNKLPKGFIKAFDELVEKTYDMPSAKALKKFGYDGVIEEMGEEFLNRLLCQTFGINGLEEYTLDGFLNNVFYKDNPEQWAVEALAFAGMGGAGHVTANATIKGLKKAKEIADKKELERLADYSRTPEFDLEKVRHIKQPYSTEEFYLDQGLIRIKGSQSLAEQLLREKLEQNNIPKADADEYLNLASENEIRDTLRVYQLNTKDVISLNNAKKIAKVSNKIFTQLKNSGLSNEDALYNSQIMTKAMTEMADLDNISIDKIHDMFKLNIQQLTTEQAQNVLKGGVAYQSANNIMSENIEKNFGQSVEELQNNFTDDIKNILAENEINYDEFEIEDVRLYGSYTTGKNKDTSDLDVIVQYKGSMKEDVAFNILNDTNLTITDVNGVERKVDINPINRELSGTIDEHIERMHEIDGAYYQTVSNVIKDDKKNLLMTHNAKSDNLDAILESGNLIAPSFAITKKDYEVDALSKFGDVTFIRKPEKIKFGSDNIYNRDIYSPRMPRPEYQLKDGTVIDSYEKDAQERLEKEKPERYKERFDKPTSERFKDAKKVMFTGYTPSGNRRYKPYTAENIIAQMKKEGLLSGENFDYGLSSLMSKFATKQKSMEELKESAKDGLYSSEQLNKDYENLKKEYEDLGDKIAPLYWDKWSFYEFQSDVFFAIAKNKKKYLKDTYNIEVPADLAKEVKDFVTKAQTMPRSYFEAKPMREVSLNEFGYALARVGTLTENQKDKLKNAYNINVIEYDNSIKEALEKVETEQPEIYFQSAYHGTPHKFDNFSTEHIGSGEGAQAHGWGLYFAENKDVSEGYREKLSVDKTTYDGKPIPYIADIKNDMLINAVLNTGKERALEILRSRKQNDTTKKQIEYIENLDVTKLKREKSGQLFEVDIPENDVLLDEEEPFSTQTENVKNSIKALIKDLLGIKSFADKDLDEEIKKVEKEKEENYNYIVSRKLELLKDLRFDDTVGKDFYNHLAEYLRVSENITSPQHKKEASLLLNQYGIKGITYDGRSDGRCYVVFDDKAVQVLNTFYQSSMLSDVDLNKNVDIVDLTPKFSTDNNLSKSDLANYIKSLIGNRITTADKKAILSFVARSKRIGKDNVRVPEHIAGSSKVENTLKGERTTIVNNIVDLIKNSTMIEISENNNKTLKPYVDNYIRFYVPVQINNDIYTVRIVAENNLNDNLFNIQIANVYDVIIDKKMPTHSTIKDNSPSNLIEPTSTNIINDNTSKNNPHTITIRDMLQGIKDTENKFYAQENIDNPLDSKRGFSTVRQDFDGTIKENLIVLLKGHADKSTLMHEFAHVYLMTLNQLAKIDAKAQMNLTTINKYLRYNGVEYTEQQHEKFAQGFEAYLKAGKAPTYKLKKAFEHFKSWLTSIYSRIETGDWQEELTLDDETKKVFDQILGDSAYSKKVEKAQELIEKARANANVLMNQEFASKKKIEPMTLTDSQKRYRDTAFDILYTALHNTKDENGKPYIKDKKELYMLFSTNKKMKQNNKGVFKRAEKLRFILEELDDPFSGGNYLPEWAEFFGYYDENEMYDSSLALAALDVIENKKYLYSESELGDFFTDEDLQHIEYECDYLINEFKNSKGDERDVAMLAYWDWIESVPDFVQEDFLNKWQLKTTEIERYENLDKFQQAKEDLILYAQKMKHQGSYSMQFAEFARQIIKRLDFLTIQDKGKMWAKFKDYDSFDAMLRDIDSIMDYAQTIEAVSDRKMMANEIDREVQQTIHEWKNGIKKTKYTYPANKLFERLRQIRKMSMEEIEDVYGAMVNEESEITYEADKVHDEDYYKTIEKMYIEFRMNGQYYNSSQFLANLLERIKTAKFTAKVARDEIDFERRMQQINLIDECAKAVNSHKGKVSKLEQIYSAEFNLNSALEMMFNTAVKEKFTLDYLYSQKDAQVGADRDAVLKQIAKVFGLENKKFAEMRLFNIFINMTKPEFKIRQRYTPDTQLGTHRVTHTDKETGKQVTEQSIAIRPKGEGYKEWEDEEIELSRMQVLYYYIQAKNPTSYKILTDMGDETHPPKGQFDKYEFNDLINQLTPQEKLMGDILQLAAEKYYDKLNQYHIEKYHTELGKVKGYFPRKTSTIQEKVYEPFNDYTQSMSNQRFQKQRTAGAGSRIKPANALEVLFTHIEQANTILIMGKQLDLMNRVFSNPDLKEKIRVVWGDRVQQDFYNQIAGNLFGGQTSALSNAEKDCASIMNNVIKSQIFAKPQVGVKQLMSFMNYGVGDEYVSAGEWWLEFAKQTLTPTQWKKNVEYMMSIPYMKDRFGRGGSQDALKQQLETRFYAKINLLDSIFSAPIRLGDIGAIILGGKPYIDILIRKGYTEEQAQRIFIEKTVNDQQSGIPSTLSNMQRNSSKSPLSKMFFAYQNTPHQYFRTAYNSIVRFKQNPNLKTGLDMAKITSIYMYIFPLLFNMASSLSVAIATGQGDDDELWKDIWKSCIGGFTFIPIAGSFINSIWTGLHGEGVYGGDWFASAAGKANTIARHASKGEITPMDIFLAVALFGEAKTGLPLTALGTELSGVGDIAQGKVAKGLLKVAGFTDYRAKKVTGEDE